MNYDKTQKVLKMLSISMHACSQSLAVNNVLLQTVPDVNEVVFEQ